MHVSENSNNQQRLLSGCHYEEKISGGENLFHFQLSNSLVYHALGVPVLYQIISSPIGILFHNC
jgi:hypothetical protein